MDFKTFLGYFFGFLALSVLYLKRALVYELIKEKLEFQKQYGKIHREAYQKEKLKQAKVQGVLKARQGGLSSGLGSNLRKLQETPKKKKKEEQKSNIEKLMGL